jgi:predicted ATPase
MIQSIQIQGYRSLRDITWHPGKLNVVIGPNASGKSNLLRALALLQDAAQGELSTEIQRDGGMGSLLWDGRTDQLRWNLRTDPLERHRDPIKESLTYDLDLIRLGTTSAYRIVNEVLANDYLVKQGKFSTPKKYLERGPGSAAIFDFEDRRLVPNDRDLADDQSFLSIAAGPFANVVVTGFRDAVCSWSIFRNVRVDRESKIREAVLSHFEKQLAPDGQNLISVLHTLYSTHREFKADVDRAMKAAFGEDFEELTFPPAADQRVQLRLRWRSLESAQSAADLSDGTLRFLFLVAALANPEPGRLVAIDEPEVGLHPSMLAVVADLALQAADRTQVILSTHSPQLLDAFGEEPIATTVVQSKDGETKLTTLDREELARWLKEFSLGALFKSGELEGMA